MIFDQLSLEYFLAGKTLPWNKVANPEPVVLLTESELDNVFSVRLVKNRAGSNIINRQYFNLKG